jgi:hypothetical protein
MTAAPPAAAPADHPDPRPDQAAASVQQPSRAGRLLGLVRKLIDYGKEVARSLRQGSAATSLFVLAQQFDTTDIALILARITRGLALAAGLEARLISHPPREAAPTPADTTAPTPAGTTPTTPIPADTPAGAASPHPPLTARRSHRRAELAKDPRLAALPTAEEIAAECRRRPVGAVIADICRDLGIGPSHKLWQELHLVIMETRGSAIALLSDVLRRGIDWASNAPMIAANMPPGWTPPRPHSERDWYTGPP